MDSACTAVTGAGTVVAEKVDVGPRPNAVIPSHTCWLSPATRPSQRMICRGRRDAQLGCASMCDLSWFRTDLAALDWCPSPRWRTGTTLAVLARGEKNDAGTALEDGVAKIEVVVPRRLTFNVSARV